MKIQITAAVAALLACSAVSDIVLADCAGPNINAMRQAFERAQSFDKSGKTALALQNYRGAEGYVCEGANPYETKAAQRALELGKPLAQSAEKGGDVVNAFTYYDQAGLYADADRMYMVTLRAHFDDPMRYQGAIEYFDIRSIESFQTNNAAAIRVAGAYRPNAAFIAEVKAMPAKGVEAAFGKEQSAFSEQYLKEYVQLIQSRPTNPFDSAAMQRFAASTQSVQTKWPDEPLKTSRAALHNARHWGANTQDKSLAQSALTRSSSIAEQRIATLTGKYSGAPKLLEDAMDYVALLNIDDSARSARVQRIKSQALTLGDQASSKNQLMLAAEYYEVAGASDKAEAARDRQHQAAMQGMQPSIDAMKQKAAELQKQYDPATVKAMQAQAEAMRKNLEAQKQANKQTSKKGAEDLEKELGL